MLFISISLLLLGNVQLYEYHILYIIHQLMDIWVASPFFTNNAVVNVWVQVFLRAVVFISLGHVPLSGLLNHMVIVCLIVWGTTRLLTKGTVACYIPTSSLWGFHFLDILTNSSYCLFYYSHPSKVWTDISLWFWFVFPWKLMMSSIFLCTLWPFVSLFLRSVCSGPFAHLGFLANI